MAGRDKRGRFRPGCSGNPNGKPANVVSRHTELKNALMAAVGPEDVARLARRMVDAGAAGDVRACRLLFEYVIGRPEPLDVAGTVPGVKLVLSELWEAI